MNIELPIAIHILGILAAFPGRSLTSETLARTFGTNPVVLRRVLAKLQRAGLVETRRGAGGGSLLARPPETIHLRAAYEAVVEDSVLLRRHPGHCGEGVAPVIAGYINELHADAEQALLERLEAVTVEQMSRELGSRIRAAGLAPRDIDCGGEQ